jgi:DNA repair protein RadC
VACGSSSIIVAHNHPSGATKPSHEDHQLTASLHRAGKLLGITLLDHVIVTDDETMSMAALGMMP